LKPTIVDAPSKDSHLRTDESGVYWKVGEEFASHQTVVHSIGEYVRGNAHTNRVEGYFSILKRDIYGIYQQLSDHRLKRYLAEFDFRYNKASGARGRGYRADGGGVARDRWEGVDLPGLIGRRRVMSATGHQNRLVITIRPSDDGLLRVDDAFRQVIDALRLFEQAERSLGNPHAAFVWRLERASTESPFMVVAIADPIDPAIDVTAQVARTKALVASGVRNLVAHAELPPWLPREAVPVVKELFVRNLNGIASTEIDFEVPAIDPLSIDRTQASAGLRAIEAINPIDTSDIPERTGFGEMEGQMLAAGRYRSRPAIQIRTHLYGFVWCVLSDRLVAQFGSETKLAEVWQGKTIAVYGRLHFLGGGRLSRVDAEDVRQIEAPLIDLDAILDPDFTAGLDPLEYLDKLHEGGLA
jgi:hypothetical protein